MKKIILLVSFFTTIIQPCFAQKSKSTKLGKTSKEELEMKFYTKDSISNALVLEEHGNLYVDDNRDFDFTTDYYSRVKLFKKEAFDKATIKISLFKKEKIHSIKAITYNLTENSNVEKTYLLDSDVYTNQTSENWKEVSFTLPKIKEGSIIEYVYSITSPYSQLSDWKFQSDIPKIKSDYTLSILGNWKYNIRLIGFFKLDRNEASVKKNCLTIPGIGNGSCIILDYGMDSIPAFKEENYMLSKHNFLSKVSFELESFTDTGGRVKKYTKTWKDADRSLRVDFLDNQSSKINYFKKRIPEDIAIIENDLDKAKKVYSFIQNHYTWNNKYWPSKKVKIKKAFEHKSGTIFDINLSLYNSLKAAGIESKLVLSSTRDRGVPTKLHPVISEFNYLIIKATINSKDYFLDATNKNLPFGLVPFNCLNGDGRVMDFKNGSYWEPIKPNIKTYKKTSAILNLTNEGFKGNVFIKKKGYYALNSRNEILAKTENEYLEDFESRHVNIEVEKYNVLNSLDLEKTLEETFEISIEEDFENNKNLRIYPFFIEKITKNPFKLNKRDYPVNFGYPRTNSYLLSLTIPKEYKVKKLPNKKSIALPNNGGSIAFQVNHKNNKLSLYFKYSIDRKTFSNTEYFYLKEFYKQLIETQNSYIELEKIN